MQVGHLYVLSFVCTCICMHAHASAYNTDIFQQLINNMVQTMFTPNFIPDKSTRELRNNVKGYVHLEAILAPL